MEIRSWRLGLGGVIKVDEFIGLILPLIEYLGFGQEKAFIRMSFFSAATILN